MDHASVPLSYDRLTGITNNFSEERLLGSGGYGRVYKGVHQDGKAIAVKLLYDMPGLDDEQFKKELNNLMNLQHDNVVQLVGYCHETQQECVEYNGRIVVADRIHRALCFEYAHNGSLHDNISDENNGHDWHTRYGIIKGICNGLKYLHQELIPPMYHLDIKPANILLDENMVPKIADFGLARLFGEEQTKITKSSIGTRGYLPPEYIEQNAISNKFDIFSLGVVIMKIMAGRMGYCKSADMSSEQFIELVHGNWRNRLQERSNCGRDMEIHSAQIRTCIGIAVRCVEYDRNKRPTVGDIVNKLNETEKNLLPKIMVVSSLSERSLPWKIANQLASNQIFAFESIYPTVLKEVLALEIANELSERMVSLESANEIEQFFAMKSENKFLTKKILALKGSTESKASKLEMMLFMNRTAHLKTLIADLLQQFNYVHSNGMNRPRPAKNTRRRNRQTPTENRARHMRSSSASRYTLMRNWKY